MKNLTDLEFSEDEIGYITLHLHAGLAKENVAQSLETARLVNRCLGLIEEYMNKKLTADSLGYNRLVSHIRYMLARVLPEDFANRVNAIFLYQMERKYAHKITWKFASWMLRKLG